MILQQITIFHGHNQHEDMYWWANKSLVVSSQCGKVVDTCSREGVSVSLSQTFPDIRCSEGFRRMESNTSHVGKEKKIDFFDSSRVSSKWPSSSVVEVPEPVLAWKIHHVILFASAVKIKRETGGGGGRKRGQRCKSHQWMTLPKSRGTLTRRC